MAICTNFAADSKYTDNLEVTERKGVRKRDPWVVLSVALLLGGGAAAAAALPIVRAVRTEPTEALRAE